MAMSALRGHMIHRSSLLFVVGGVIVIRNRYGRTAVTGIATGLFDKWARIHEPPFSKEVASLLTLNVQVTSKGTGVNDLRLWTGR